MIKEGGLSFETQLKIEFLSPNNGGKKHLEKSMKSRNENLEKILNLQKNITVQ